LGLGQEGGDVGAELTDERPIAPGYPAHGDIKPVRGVTVGELGEEPFPRTASQPWRLPTAPKERIDFAQVDGLDAHAFQDGPVLSLPGPVQLGRVADRALAQEGARRPGVRLIRSLGEDRCDDDLAALGLCLHERTARQHGVIQVG